MAVENTVQWRRVRLFSDQYLYAKEHPHDRHPLDARGLENGMKPGFRLRPTDGS